jgi:hypothetical protein
VKQKTKEGNMAKAKAKASVKGAEIGKAIGGAIGKEIEKEMADGECGEKKWHHHGSAGGGNAVYGLGFIGSAVYFISHATGFWMGVLGLLKAIVWPALLIYKALGVLGL